MPIGFSVPLGFSPTGLRYRPARNPKVRGKGYALAEVAPVAGKAEATRQLTYRCTPCERAAWAEDAGPYNDSGMGRLRERVRPGLSPVPVGGSVGKCVCGGAKRLNGFGDVRFRLESRQGECGTPRRLVQAEDNNREYFGIHLATVGPTCEGRCYDARTPLGPPHSVTESSSIP